LKTPSRRYTKEVLATAGQGLDAQGRALLEDRRLFCVLAVRPARGSTVDRRAWHRQPGGFALGLTLVDSAFAGRAYAGYGGIYIAASLAWLWVVERQAPTRADVLAAEFAIAGALVIYRVCRPSALIE